MVFVKRLLSTAGPWTPTWRSVISSCLIPKVLPEFLLLALTEPAAATLAQSPTLIAWQRRCCQRLPSDAADAMRPMRCCRCLFSRSHDPRHAGAVPAGTWRGAKVPASLSSASGRSSTSKYNAHISHVAWQCQSSSPYSNVSLLIYFRCSPHAQSHILSPLCPFICQSVIAPGLTSQSYVPQHRPACLS